MGFPKLAGAAGLAALMALGACSGTSQMTRSEKTRIEIDRAFGKVGPRSNPELYKAMDDTPGFSFTRLYSEKPTPFAFGGKAPESFANALVIDVAIDMKVVDDFPVYRVGIEPKKVNERHVSLWPSHVVLDSGNEAVGLIAARLPEDRAPDETGLIWTDWTYCGECFDLKKIDGSTDPDVFAKLGAGLEAAAKAPEIGSPYAGTARFTSVPGVGILIGEAALEMAPKASEVVAASQLRIADMIPARAAYADMKKAFAASRSPTVAMKEACGTYEPNQDRRDAALELARFRAHQECALDAVKGFDQMARETELAEFTRKEGRLAATAALKQADRVIFPRVETEIAEALGKLNAAEKKYAGEFGKVRPKVQPSASAPDVETLAPAVTPAAPLGTIASIAATTQEAAAAEELMAKAARWDGPVFVARLLEDGANMEIGQHSGQCIGEMACETGSIAALITATSYCSAPAELTKTVPGWGLVVQKYEPASAGDWARLEDGQEASPVHILSRQDTKALAEGLAGMRALKVAGEQAHFASYPEFYRVNTEKLGCIDQWRDAAKHRVINNAAEVQIDG